MYLSMFKEIKTVLSPGVRLLSAPTLLALAVVQTSPKINTIRMHLVNAATSFEYIAKGCQHLQLFDLMENVIEI